MRKRQQMLLAGRVNCDQRRLAWWVASLAQAIRGRFSRALLLSFAGHLETIAKRIKLLDLPIGTCWSDPRQFYIISGEWWVRMADVPPMKHPQQPGVKRDGSICGGAFWFMWGKAVAKKWNDWDQVKTFVASVTNIPESINNILVFMCQEYSLAIPQIWDTSGNYRYFWLPQCPDHPRSLGISTNFSVH